MTPISTQPAIEFGVCKLDLKLSGTNWAFDDEIRGLINEPFVGYTNRIIDQLVAEAAVSHFKQEIAQVVQDKRESNIGITPAPCSLLFSASEPPPAVRATACVLKERHGDWSTYSAFGLDGPVCPALLKYFPVPPPTIWAWVE
jgi:hypothetical protein